MAEPEHIKLWPLYFLIRAQYLLINVQIFSYNTLAIFSNDSNVQPAICGERITLSELIKYFQEGFSVKLFLSEIFSKEVSSYSKTSRQAPRIFPDFKFLTRSSVRTHLPRAVLMKYIFLLNLFMKLSLIKNSVS